MECNEIYDSRLELMRAGDGILQEGTKERSAEIE
jgi:hypothetical protein